MPKPEDMASAPAWDNYVVAQAVQAALGLIPRSSLAVGVSIQKTAVAFTFQLSKVTESDGADMADIIDGFEMLIDFVVPVTSSYEIVEERKITPSGSPVRWIFVSNLK